MTDPLNDLTKTARSNLDRAYAILGHRPGPGYDIAFLPTNPVSSTWRVEGKSKAGKAYLKHIHTTKVDGGAALARFKHDLADWGLSYYTDWGNVVEERSDP